MKRASLVSLVVLCLSLTANAAPPPEHRDEPRVGRGGETPIQRVVRVVVKKLRLAAQGWEIGDPRP